MNITTMITARGNNEDLLMANTQSTPAYDLHCPFDIELHQQNFVDYLEAIIEPDGSVHYAVPSHNIYLERLLMRERDWSEQELEEACPQEYWCDYHTWLLMESGCISVWTCGYRYAEEPNEVQSSALGELIDAGLVADVRMR